MRTREFRSFFIGLLAYWVIGLLGYSPVFAQTPVPFIAIGDSITYGGKDGASYLCPLQTQLGNSVAFIGPRTTTCPNGTMIANAGYPGATTQAVLDKSNPTNQSENWLNTIPTTGNVVALISLGTNDEYQHILTQTTVNNLTQVVNQIKIRNPNAAVFLAQIIPARYDDMHNLNDAIAQIPGVTIINEGVDFTTSDLVRSPNEVHPNENGATIIANNIYAKVNTPISNLVQSTAASDRLTSQQSSSAQPIGTQQNAPQTGYNTGMAAGLTLPGGFTINGPAELKFSTIGDVLNRAIPFVFAIAGIGLLVILLSAGFEFLTSAGDAKKLETAQQRLTYAVVGFLVIFTAYWLVQIAGRIFGLTEVQTIFK